MNAFVRWKRAWRMSEIRLQALALIVAVTAISSIGFFSDRIIQKKATEFLGGDLVIQSTRPLSEDYLKQAQSVGIKSAESIEFRSMVRNNADSENASFILSSIRAVSEAYPLRGAITIAETLDTEGKATQQRPKRGEIWAESRLFSELEIQLGSHIKLGKETFLLSRVITKSNELGNSPIRFAPNIIMNMDDLKKTGLYTPVSRANFKYLFSGTDSEIDTFKQRLQPQLKTAEKIITLDDSSPAIQKAVEKAGRFLGLASLLSLVLAGVAIALGSYSLLKRETKQVAVIKALGGSRTYLLKEQLYRLSGNLMIGLTIGLSLGYLIQMGIAYVSQQFLGEDLPAPGAKPFIIATLMALIMMIGFSLPQVLRLIKTPPIAIFKGSPSNSGITAKGIIISAFIAVFFLMWLQAGELELAAWLFLSLLGALVFFWGGATILFKFLNQPSIKWRWKLPPFTRYALRSNLLVAVFGIGFFSLFFLMLIQTDLLERWRSSLPQDAPNQFITNIQQNEATDVQHFLQQNNFESTLYPVMRGRLIAVNEQQVTAATADNNHAFRLLSRELNITTTHTLPASNKVVSGEWFNSDTMGISVEDGAAEALGVGVGDTLSFDFAGQVITGEITNLRKVEWNSMLPNFIVITTPNLLEKLQPTYITSLHLSPDNVEILNRLVEKFPAIVTLDIGAALRKIREIINQASLAVQGIFMFTILSGIVVLLAALQSQRADRTREIAIQKTLGATKKQLNFKVVMEFAIIGGLSGFLAAILALLIGNTLAYLLFEISPVIDVVLVFAGTFGGAMLVSLAGYLSLRSLLEVEPVKLLSR